MERDLRTIPLSELYEVLASGPNGLTTKESQRRQNPIQRQQWSPLRPLFEPLSLVYAILAVVLLAVAPANWPTSMGIALLVLANTTIRLTVEHRALLSQLKLGARFDISAKQVQTKRDGVWVGIPAAELVQGDVIELTEGSFVPADCRLAARGRSFSLSGEHYNQTQVGDVCSLESQVTGGTGEAIVFATRSIVDALRLDEPANNGKFALILCFVLVVAVIEATIIYVRFGYSHQHGIATLLALLVGSTPIAIPTSISIIRSSTANELVAQEVYATHTNALGDLPSATHLVINTSALIEPRPVLGDVATYGPFTTNEVKLFTRYINTKPSDSALEHEEYFSYGAPLIGHPDIEILHFRPLDVVRGLLELTFRTKSERRVKRLSLGLVGHVIEACERNRTELLEEQLERDVDAFAMAGMTTRGLMYEELGEQYDDVEAKDTNWEDIRGNGFELIGVLAFVNPLKVGSQEAVAQLIAQGIKLKLVASYQLSMMKLKWVGRSVGLGEKMFHSRIFRNEMMGDYPTLDTLLRDANGFAGMTNAEVQHLVDHLGHTCAYIGRDVHGLVPLAMGKLSAEHVTRFPSDLLAHDPSLLKYASVIQLARQTSTRWKQAMVYICASTVYIMLCFTVLTIVHQSIFTPFAMLLVAANVNMLALGLAAGWAPQREITKPSNNSHARYLALGVSYGVYSALSTVVFVVVIHKRRSVSQMVDLVTPGQLDTLLYLQSSQMVNLIALVISFNTQFFKFKAKLARSLGFVSIVGVGLSVSSLLSAYMNWSLVGLNSVGTSAIGFIWIWNLGWTSVLALLRFTIVRTIQLCSRHQVTIR